MKTVRHVSGTLASGIVLHGMSACEASKSLDAAASVPTSSPESSDAAREEKTEEPAERLPRRTIAD